jgi:hypothetical protein
MECVIPYNADDEQTCAEILSDKLQAAHPDILLMKLAAYLETAMRDFNADNQSYQPSQQP